jgi:hypothetical protein
MKEGLGVTWEWLYTPVIPALGWLRQEDPEFKASLGHRVKTCLKNK